MTKTTVDVLKRWGKTPSCLLAALFAFAAAQSAQAAWAWKCTGTDTKWSTAANWNKSYTGVSNGYYFRKSVQNFSTYELTFDSTVSVAYLVRVDNGTSETTPMVWRALDDAYGFTTTATGTPLGMGTDATYGAGYLKIVGGTYYFPGEVRMGGNFAGGLTLENVKSFTTTGNLNFRKPGSFLRSKNSDVTASLINLSVNANDTSYAVFDGGSLTFSSGSVIGYGKNSTGTFIATNLTLNTTAEFALGGYGTGSTGAKGYVEKTGGDWTLGAVLNIAKQSGSTGVFTNFSGTVAVGDDLYVGRSGGTGTLAVEGGTVTVVNTKAVHLGYSSGHGWLYLDGGALVCKHVHNYNDGHVVFNGGTLKANAADANGLLGSGLAVTVGANGGTIDANSLNVALDTAIGADGDTGPMTFTGGGTVTANGRLNYAGKTRVVTGTTLSVGADQMADIRSQGGLVVLPASSAAPGSYTVLTLTGGGTLTADDVAACKVALVSSANGYIDIPADEYAITRANDDTELVVTLNTARFAWSAGMAGDNWTDADKWNGGAATWADGAVAVFAADGDNATVDAAVSAPRVEFYANATLAGSGTLTTTNIFVAAGKTVTVSAPLADGQLAKTGEGTLIISGNTKAVTGITVEGGILKYGAQSILTKGIIVEVKDGAACDVNGCGNGNVVNYKLAGSGPDGAGALRNTGADIGTSSAQMGGIELSADATVGGTKNFGFVYSSYGEAHLELNGHTLTLDLASGKSFWLISATGTSSGTFLVKSGKAHFYNSNSKGVDVSLPNVDFVIDGANAVFNKTSDSRKATVRDVTVKNGGEFWEANNNTYARNFTVLDGGKVPDQGAKWIIVSGTILVSNETQNVTIYPPFLPSGSTTPQLVKKGAANLTLAVNHTENRIDGGIEIFGGTVVMSSSRSSGQAPQKAISSRAVPVAIHAGGTLDATQCGTATFNTTTVSVEGTLKLAGPASLAATGELSLAGGSLVDIAALNTTESAITASSVSLADGATVSVPSALASGRNKLFTLSSGTFAADAADGLEVDCAYPYALEADGDTIYFSLGRGYATVDNNLTSLTVSGTMELLGAGGVKLSALAIPEDATLVLDPISTPIYVSSQPSIAGKIALSSEYAGMTCGEIVLLAFDGTDFDPTTVFDASSVAGEVTGLDFRKAPDGKNQLVLTVGDYANASEIRILPIGDSITHGYVKNIPSSGTSQQAQYRTLVAARLAAKGYKPVMLGHLNRDASNTAATCNAAGVQQPDEWIWHSGVSGDAIATSTNYGGVRDNLHLYLDIAGEPDVVMMLLGTNDIGGQNHSSGAETFALYTNLVWKINALRPNTKIVGSTILERSEAKGYNGEVTTFNSLLLGNLAELPANYVCTNLYPLVPQAVADNYFDGLHPTMKGFEPVAKGFAAKIAETLPLVGEHAFAGPIDDMLTDEPQTAQGATNNVPAAYRDGMVHVFTIDSASEKSVMAGAAPYTERVTALPLTKGIKKAGYYMELVRKGTSRRRFVWVDFDATGKTLDEIDFPWMGANIDLVVDDMHVYSNDGGVHNVAANVTGVKGIVVGTCHNFNNASKGNAAIPEDVTAACYGWDDSLQTSGNYGGFQAHRIFSSAEEHWNGAEVLFAWNRWGLNDSNKIYDEIGIGDFSNSQASKSMNYIFTGQSVKGLQEKIAAGAYQVRHLEIWVEPDPESPAGVQGKWVGGQGDDRFSYAPNWDDGQVPAAGTTLDFTGVAVDTTVNADVADTVYGTILLPAHWIALNGSLHLTTITNALYLAVESGATLTVDEDAVLNNNSGNYSYMFRYNKGTIDIGGKFVNDSPSGKKPLLYYAAGSTGSIKVGGAENRSTENAFSLCGNHTTPITWIVGAGGLARTDGAKGFMHYAAGNGEITVKAAADFTASAPVYAKAAFKFDTDDESGVAQTITSTGGLEGAGTVTIAGSGVFAGDCEQNASTMSGGVNVTDTATLAINPGKTVTTGTITVNGGSSLKVAESGTVALQGGLTLADGATLAFNFTDRGIAPVLDVTDKTVTVNGAVLVKASGNGVWPKRRTYTLTSGGGFSGKSVTLAAGASNWAKKVGVDEDGNIYVEILPRGLAVKVL